jgi:hypothetical protein
MQLPLPTLPRFTAGAPNALIILAAQNVSEMRQAIQTIEQQQGRIVHVFPTHALIGFVPPRTEQQLIGVSGIIAVYRSWVPEESVAPYGAEAQQAAYIWNTNFVQPMPIPTPEPGAPTPIPLVGDVLEPELPSSQPPGFEQLGNAPGSNQTSEFMAGKVAVGIILPESNGTLDPSTESWDTTRMNQVVAKIQAAMNWWANTNPNGDLSFYYDIHYQVPTRYEPINRPSGDDALWIAQTLSTLGYSGSNWVQQTYNYLNAIRANYGTDWAVVAFVVDSLNDPDGAFPNGYFGYTYGFLIVMTYDNDNWGISRMDSVMAHEFAHDFGAGDEYCAPGYACCGCGGQLGYLGIPNLNCEAGCDHNNNGICDGDDSTPNSGCNSCSSCVEINCLMRGGSTDGGVCQVSQYQVGMRDSDGNGILDPVDTYPSITVDLPASFSSNMPTITGVAEDIPYHSPTRPDVTINYITSVWFWVDNGGWQPASAVDGAFDETTENYTLTTSPLAPGQHEIWIYADNRVGNYTMIYSYFSVGNNPDLVPFQGADWQYPVVPSSVQGTHSVNTLYAGQPTYFDWGVQNQGASTSNSFYVDLYIDSTQFIHYPFSGISGNGWYDYFYDWVATISTSGWHTVRIVVDPENTVPESNEGNNSWERQFYWEPPSDTTPPTGRITSPTAGSATNTCPITVQAEASDSGSGVAWVKFWVWYDGAWHEMATDTNGTDGWSATWDCSAVPDQTVWFTTWMQDNAGNRVMDPGGYVDVVLDRVAPTGTIVSPPDNSTITTNSVPISVNANDERSGVALVEFWVLYDNGWHWLADDWDGTDGWGTVWDASAVSDQTIALWAYIWDWVWNLGWTANWNVTLYRSCPNVLVNGDFEGGPGSAPWVQSSANDLELITNDLPHTGSFSIWFAGYNNAVDSIYQTVSIPGGATSASLSYWWYMTTEETMHSFDFLRVKIRNASGQDLQELQAISDGDLAGNWVYETVNLSAYAGQTIQVYFVATTDSSLLTSFYIDDVRLARCACYDFDGDGRIEVDDVMQVANRWRCKCGDSCYNSLYDIDGDCDIDIVDIMLVVKHWGETCP